METKKRSTKTKELVISVLNQSASALSHEEIAQNLQEKADRVTVYRILQSFYDDGKVHKIVGDNGKTYYSLCRHCNEEQHHDEHPHFRCTECNAITCLEENISTQVVPSGYSVANVSSFITGVCAKCNTMTVLFLLLFVSAFGSSIVAQTDSLAVVQEHSLPEVVVSAGWSRLQGENVANVEKLNLNKSFIQGISLSDKLTNIAGLDNVSTGTGIGKPVIRGLSGNRIAVFSQGIRIENQQWGDEHGLGLDELGYGQVEVIKGPASLLYGSDALGGVLYFADEPYADNNSVEAALHSEFHSNTLGLRNTGAVKLSKNNFHLNLFGGYTSHKDYADGAGNEVPNSRFSTGDLKAIVGYTGKRFNTALKYNYLNEKYGLTEQEEGEAEHEYRNGRTPEMPYQKLNTHILSSENSLYFENQSRLKIDLGWVFNNRQELEDEHHHENEGEEHGEEAALNMNLNTLSYAAKWYSPHWKAWEMIAGSQGMFQTNANRGEETLIPDATTFDIGAFTMANFHYSESGYWQFGLRFDNRNIQTAETGDFETLQKNYPAFNLSIGVYQSIWSNWTLRSNLSTGFRAPNMYELLSNGVHHGTNRYEIGNQNLKSENSYQIDASFTYKSVHLEVFASPYFNYMRNFIYLQPAAEEIDEMPVYNYLQTNAFLYGGEAGAHFHPHPLDWLHLECSYSNTLGQNRDNDYLPLMPSQKLKANLSVIFSAKKVLRKYSFYLQNLYSFAQNRVAELETATPAYNLLNAGANFEFRFGHQRLMLHLAANNLLDTKYFDHLSRYKTEGIYNMGRNVVVKISLPFNGSL